MELNELRNFAKKLKSNKRNFNEFPKFVIQGKAPDQTILKCYLSKDSMISVHHENNGKGFVFVNYTTRATVLKNLSPYENQVSEDEWFEALAAKIFYYFTLNDQMTEVLMNRRKRLGKGINQLLLSE